MSDALPEPRAVGAVAAAITAATAIAALVTAVGFAASARAWLHFGFGGVPETPHAAWDTFVNNARVAAGVAIAAGVLGMRWAACDDETSLAATVAESFVRGLGVVCDLWVMALVVLNVMLVGSAIGAYGTRMAAVVMPHGPVELAAYCVVLDLYRRSRRGPLPRAAWAGGLGLCVALLGAAALLETFVTW